MNIFALIVEVICKCVVLLLPLVCIETMLKDGIKTKEDKMMLFMLIIIFSVFLLKLV